MNSWRFNSVRDVWEYHSSKHIVFKYSSEMIAIVLDVCDFDDETRDDVVRVATVEGAALLQLKRHDGKAMQSRRRYATMTDDEITEAFAWADAHDLFTMSDTGVYEVEVKET